MSDIDNILSTPEAVAHVRKFEQARHELSLLADADKPDKHTTVFISAGDLVWAWLADTGKDGALAFIGERATRDELAGFVEAHEFRDPELVRLVAAAGGPWHSRQRPTSTP